MSRGVMGAGVDAHRRAAGLGRHATGSGFEFVAAALVSCASAPGEQHEGVHHEPPYERNHTSGTIRVGTMSRQPSVKAVPVGELRRVADVANAKHGNNNTLFPFESIAFAAGAVPRRSNARRVSCDESELAYPAPVNTLPGIVGAGLLINATWMLVQRLSARGVTSGRVVDHEATTSPSLEPSSDATTLYRPVIEFTHGQRRYRFTGVGGDREPRPERGTRMPVRFLPDHPETAYVATFANMWVMPIVWAVAGAVALFFAWR